MCRLFGLRSVTKAEVRDPLVDAENALVRQSREHADGWGIAYFDGPRAIVAREAGPAYRSAAFRATGRRIASHAVLAHVRKASVGRIAPENTHPFSHGGWLFAHNGTVSGYAERQQGIERAIDRDLRSRLRGETDSERCFYLFLSELRRGPEGGIEPAARALARTAARILHGDPPGEKPSSLTFLTTDGDRLLALRLGRTLSYAAHRGRSLAIASEPTRTGGGWRAVREGWIVGTDGSSRLRHLSLRALTSRT